MVEMSAETDFILVGLAEANTCDHRFALLPSLLVQRLLPSLNPRRALLEPVILTSNNQRCTDFVLVGGGSPPEEGPHSAQAQAAWLRNHRRALPAVGTTCTDFVLLGAAADGDHHYNALLPELNNHRRSLLRSVVLTSNQRGITDHVIIGSVRDVSPRDTPQAQAAWLRNHRRALAEAKATALVVYTAVPSKKRDLDEIAETQFTLVARSNKKCARRGCTKHASSHLQIELHPAVKARKQPTIKRKAPTRAAKRLISRRLRMTSVPTAVSAPIDIPPATGTCTPPSDGEPTSPNSIFEIDSTSKASGAKWPSHPPQQQKRVDTPIPPRRLLTMDKERRPTAKEARKEARKEADEPQHGERMSSDSVMSIFA